MPNHLSSSEIAIIGGGPAGLMAADVLSARGHQVIIYDQMPSMGRKFLLAGRGGLNLTHSEAFEPFLDKYGAAKHHLVNILKSFDADALRNWCHDLGLPTFIGSSGRVFPDCFKASPLLRAWLVRLEQQGVKMRFRHKWLGFHKPGFGERDSLVFLTPGGRFEVSPQAILLALGGASWPRMGSDGRWTPILTEQCVDVSPLRPANCGFYVHWSAYFAQKFQGQPLKRIALNFKGKSLRAEAVITHKGIEGSGIYALSSHLREAVLQHSPQILTIDLRPDIDLEDLTKNLTIKKQGTSLSNHLRKCAGLSPVAIGLLRELNQNLSDDPKHLAHAIKNVPVPILSPFGLERAISTAGGVKFTELDENLMLCKKPTVFIAGEMLDWEAPTGGYLLQASFATGVCAAKGILSYLAAVK